MRVNADRGWLGMFVSLDCMHYCWNKFHVAWQGSFNDKDGNKSIILEVIVNQRLWIWYAYFSLSGGNNDLNVSIGKICWGVQVQPQFRIKWQCTSLLLFAHRWDLSSMVLFCIHHTQTTRRKKLAFFQNARGNLQRC